MATLSMASGGKREREAGVGDAEMIGVQLHTAIRTTKPLHNYLAVPRDDSLTPKYRRLIVDWVAEVSLQWLGLRRKRPKRLATPSCCGRHASLVAS